MFLKITPLVTLLTTCLGEIYQNQQRDAISSFIFARGDTPLSFNYSSIHLYTTPKSTEVNENLFHSMSIRQAEDKLLQSNLNQKVAPENRQEVHENMYRQFRSNLMQSDDFQYTNDYHTSATSASQLQNSRHPKNLDANQFQSLRQGPALEQMQSLKYYQEPSNQNSNKAKLTSKNNDQRGLSVPLGSLGEVHPTGNLLRKDHLEPRLHSDPSQNHKQDYRFVVGHNIAPKQVVRENIDAFPELFENIKLTKLPEKTKETLRNYIIHHESEHHTVPTQSQLKADENIGSEHPFLLYAPKQIVGTYGKAFVHTKVNERLEAQRPKPHGIHLNVARFYNIATSGKKASDMKVYSTGLNSVSQHSQNIVIPNLTHQGSAFRKSRLMFSTKQK